MKPFITNSLKQFVQTCDDIFGHKSQFVSFESSPTNTGVQGFQSDSIFGCIRYSNQNGDLLSSPPLLLKVTPVQSPVIEAVLCQYGNEIFFYGHMLPFFSHLEPSILDLFPKFYASFTQTYPQSTQAVILLENLADSSYQNATQRSFLDYAHLSLMVQSLGRFHGYSYLAKEQDLQHFHAHALSLNPIYSTLIGKDSRKLPEIGLRGLTRLAQYSEYESSVPKIRHLLTKVDQIFVDLFKNERFNPWAVVCHGDYLSGNIMFKYDQGQPVALKMVDFAMSTYSSPVLDLALVLYMNADQKTRDLYWDRLIDDYCQGLSSLPVPIARLPSREDIMKEFQSKAFYAYILASFFLWILVAEDFNLESHLQFLPEEYIDKPHSEWPDQVDIDVCSNVGGEIVTEMLADILKDMLKRGFI